MFEYRILDPFEQFIANWFKWKRADLIEVDSQKMRSFGFHQGDHISSSELAAISVTPMAVI